MCWSATASLNTFLFSVFGFAFGLANGYPVRLLLFAMTFSTVQLAEFFIWRSIDTRDAAMNALASKCLLAVLIAEPYLAANMIEEPQRRALMVAAYTAFLCMSAAYVVFATPGIEYRSAPGQNGHLRWLWTNNLVPIIVVWSIFLLLPILLSRSYVGICFGIVTVAFSAYFYYRYDTMGTMWCWTATAFWLVVVAVALCKSKVCRVFDGA